jgi:hypothetical protein
MLGCDIILEKRCYFNLFMGETLFMNKKKTASEQRVMKARKELKKLLDNVFQYMTHNGESALLSFYGSTVPIHNLKSEGGNSIHTDCVDAIRKLRNAKNIIKRQMDKLCIPDENKSKKSIAKNPSVTRKYVARKNSKNEEVTKKRYVGKLVDLRERNSRLSRDS